MSYYVILVHGTASPFQRLSPWRSRKWDWLDVASPFVTQLASALPDAVIDVNFRWSGRNSIIERYRAALVLRRYVRQRMKEHPEADHVVIAHSHGGTAALMAASSGSIGPKLAAIICLSTPFLHGQGRFSFALWAFQAPLLLLWGSLFAGSMFWKPFLSRSGVITVFLVLGLVIELLGYRLSKVYLAKVVGIWRRMELPTHLDCHVLIARSSADEASGALISMRFATWVLHGVWWSASRFARIIFNPSKSSDTLSSSLVARAVSLGLVEERVFRHVWTDQKAERRRASLWTPIVALLAYVALTWWLRTTPVFDFTLQLGGGPFPIGAFLVLLWPFILCGVIFLVAMLVTSCVLAMTVGPEMLWAAPALDVSAEATPSGLWSVCQFTHSPLPLNETRLSHGTFQDDPRIVDWIARWLVQRRP